MKCLSVLFMVIWAVLAPVEVQGQEQWTQGRCEYRPAADGDLVQWVIACEAARIYVRVERFTQYDGMGILVVREIEGGPIVYRAGVRRDDEGNLVRFNVRWKPDGIEKEAEAQETLGLAWELLQDFRERPEFWEGVESYFRALLPVQDAGEPGSGALLYMGVPSSSWPSS